MHVDYNMQNRISEKMLIELGFEKLNGVGFKERKRKREQEMGFPFSFFKFFLLLLWPLSAEKLSKRPKPHQ